MRAFLYVGQGQQFHQMGVDLATTYPKVKQIYNEATELVGYDLLNIDASMLAQTQYTQVALFVLGHAITSLLEDLDITAQASAGLSLGEYNALVQSKALSFKDACLVLKHRGQLMQDAYQPFETGMLALLKTNREDVENALQNSNIEVCNVNTPSQIVVGGFVHDLDAIKGHLKEKGIRMQIPLKVSVVSHMKLLETQSNLLRDVLNTVRFQKPESLFFNNIQGIQQTENFVETLSKHISQPTEFALMIQNMVDAGVKEFVEIGPKGTLSKFVKEICGDSVRCSNIYDCESLGAYIHE